MLFILQSVNNIRSSVPPAAICWVLEREVGELYNEAIRESWQHSL